SCANAGATKDAIDMAAAASSEVRSFIWVLSLGCSRVARPLFPAAPEVVEFTDIAAVPFQRLMTAADRHEPDFPPTRRLQTASELIYLSNKISIDHYIGFVIIDKKSYFSNGSLMPDERENVQDGYFPGRGSGYQP